MQIGFTFFRSTFVPLIFSAVFYASNGENYVSYPDALFLCVSAATVTGLATIDLSLLTAWQQVILFIQMFLGSPVSQAFPSRFNFGGMLRCLRVC